MITWIPLLKCKYKYSQFKPKNTAVLNMINFMVHQVKTHQNRLLAIGCTCHNRLLYLSLSLSLSRGGFFLHVCARVCVCERERERERECARYLPIHSVFSTPSFPTSWILAYTPILICQCLAYGQIMRDSVAEPGGALVRITYPEAIKTRVSEQKTSRWVPGLQTCIWLVFSYILFQPHSCLLVLLCSGCFIV
jgi:hypothetical protein